VKDAQLSYTQTSKKELTSMVRTISESELAASLTHVLRHVQNEKERYVVEHQGKPMVVIGPAVGEPKVPRVSLQEVAEKLKGIEMPGGGFADDLEEIQANQQNVELRNWPS
jgi:hypothetical protein